jgi:hypothetical protein
MLRIPYLCLAVFGRSWRATHLLLCCGANTEHKIDDTRPRTRRPEMSVGKVPGATPLLLATMYGLCEVAHVLLSAGAKATVVVPNSLSGQNGEVDITVVFDDTFKNALFRRCMDAEAFDDRLKKLAHVFQTHVNLRNQALGVTWKLSSADGDGADLDPKEKHDKLLESLKKALDVKNSRAFIASVGMSVLFPHSVREKAVTLSEHFDVVGEAGLLVQLAAFLPMDQAILDMLLAFLGSRELTPCATHAMAMPRPSSNTERAAESHRASRPTHICGCRWRARAFCASGSTATEAVRARMPADAELDEVSIVCWRLHDLRDMMTILMDFLSQCSCEACFEVLRSCSERNRLSLTLTLEEEEEEMNGVVMAEGEADVAEKEEETSGSRVASEADLGGTPMRRKKHPDAVRERARLRRLHAVKEAAAASAAVEAAAAKAEETAAAVKVAEAAATAMGEELMREEEEAKGRAARRQAASAGKRSGGKRASRSARPVQTATSVEMVREPKATETASATQPAEATSNGLCSSVAADDSSAAAPSRTAVQLTAQPSVAVICELVCLVRLRRLTYTRMHPAIARTSDCFESRTC